MMVVVDFDFDVDIVVIVFLPLLALALVETFVPFLPTNLQMPELMVPVELQRTEEQTNYDVVVVVNMKQVVSYQKLLPTCQKREVHPVAVVVVVAALFEVVPSCLQMPEVEQKKR